jgi:HEAT repeat protein
VRVVTDVDACLAALGDPRKAVQRPAAERLAEGARRDPTIRPRVVALLASADPRRRWGAAYALARLEAAPLDAVPALVEALGSGDGDVRWAAARILTTAVAAAPALGVELTRLLDAPSMLQRKMALYCVRDLGGTVPVARVRHAALSASAALLPSGEDTAELLAALVEDVDPGVRRAAAATLGRLGTRSPGVERRLAEASRSDDAALARAATQALSRLADGGRSGR